MRNAQSIAELKGIETPLNLVHHHHDVVRRLVIHHQLSMTIKDSTAGRIFYLFEEGVGVGTLLVVITRNLECEQTDNVDDHYQDSHPTYHIMPIFKTGILHLERTLSMARITNNVSTALAAV